MAQASTDTALRLISDAKADLQQRVLAVLRFATHWATTAARAEKQALLAPAMAVLSGILRDQWPAGACFGDSDATSGKEQTVLLQLTGGASLTCRRICAVLQTVCSCWHQTWTLLCWHGDPAASATPA